ncbi:hypothetical protein C8R47DRAFT_1225127 [Mycena vitilis]|nr:hypothetical protein C8R47DRAFT_1225127 [Mycena vitilis]
MADADPLLPGAFPYLPKFHAAAHHLECRARPSYPPPACETNGEQVEQSWASLGSLAPVRMMRTRRGVCSKRARGHDDEDLSPRKRSKH